MHHEVTRETHHSLATTGLYEGLVRIFDGHMMTLDELYLTPAKIPARFERLSERLGHSFSLPEAKRAMEAARNEGGDSPRRCH